MSTAEPTRPSRHQNLYAHHLWMQQRFYAGLLLAIGLVSIGLAVYQRQILNANTVAFVVYLPLGLIMAGGFLFYRWRSKYGGMEVSEAQRLKSLEDENRRLKHLVADLSLDKEVLKAVISKNGWGSQLNGKM